MSSLQSSLPSFSSSFSEYAPDPGGIGDFTPDPEFLREYGLSLVKEYHRLSSPRKRSVVWDWGFVARRVDEEEDIPYWVCYICWRRARSNLDLKLYRVGATSSARDHLIRDHSFLSRGSQVIPPGSRESWALHHHSLPLRNGLLNVNAAYLKWVILDGIPFRQASSVAHNGLMESLSGGDPQLRVKNHQSVYNRVAKVYEECLVLVSHTLSRASSKISLSYDIWTSATDIPFFGIEAHFISGGETPRQRNTLLTVEEVQGAHTGRNLSRIMKNTVQAYKIKERIAYLMSDNADNNTTAVEELGNITNIPVSGKRLRCACHIVNLICKQLSTDHLAGTDNDESDGLQCTQDSGIPGHPGQNLRSPTLPTNVDVVSVERLKSIITHIKSSSKREQEFLTIQTTILEGMVDQSQRRRDQPLRIIRENQTRWNTRYDSISRALRLRATIDQYCARHASLQGLTGADWAVLEELQAIYHPFLIRSKILESNAEDGAEGALFESYLVIHLIVKDLVSLIAEIPRRPVLQELASPLQRALSKAMKYQLKMRDPQTPAYMLAVLLHPRYKKRFFDLKEPKNPSTAQVITKLRESVATLRQDISVPESSSSTDHTVRSAYQDFLGSWGPGFEPQEISSVDEVSEYLNEPQEKMKAPMEWWVANRTRFPALYRIAMDLFATPASAADMERIWSSCGRLLDTERARMNAKTLRKLVCLQHWFRNGIISDLDLEKIVFSQANLAVDNDDDEEEESS